MSRNIQKARAELEVGEQTGNNANRPYDVMGLGRVAYWRGRAEVVAVLLSTRLAMLQAQGKAIVPLLRLEIERLLAAVEHGLDIWRAAFLKHRPANDAPTGVVYLGDDVGLISFKTKM